MLPFTELRDTYSRVQGANSVNIIEHITVGDLMNVGLTFFIEQRPFLETVSYPFTYDETTPLRSFTIFSACV